MPLLKRDYKIRMSHVSENHFYLKNRGLQVSLITSRCNDQVELSVRVSDDERTDESSWIFIRAVLTGKFLFYLAGKTVANFNITTQALVWKKYQDQNFNVGVIDGQA